MVWISGSPIPSAERCVRPNRSNVVRSCHDKFDAAMPVHVIERAGLGVLAALDDGWTEGRAECFDRVEAKGAGEGQVDKSEAAGCIAAQDHVGLLIEQIAITRFAFVDLPVEVLQLLQLMFEAWLAVAVLWAKRQNQNEESVDCGDCRCKPCSPCPSQQKPGQCNGACQDAQRHELGRTVSCSHRSSRNGLDLRQLGCGFSHAGPRVTPSLLEGGSITGWSRLSEGA